MPRLLKVSEVANRLNVNRWRAYELIAQGAIPHVRLGRQIRVDPEVLEDWIRRGGTGRPDDNSAA